MAEECECEEWAASTDSQKVALSKLLGWRECMWIVLTPFVSGLEEEWVSGREVAPPPNVAENKTPVLGSSGSGADLGRGAVSDRGRFGQPRTPTLTSPSSIRARQTAYCPPRKNPFVPSIGSSAQTRPEGPPVDLPMSRRESNRDSSFMLPPSWDSSSGDNDVEETREKISEVKVGSEARLEDSSSAMMASLGKAWRREEIIRA